MAVGAAPANVIPGQSVGADTLGGAAVRFVTCNALGATFLDLGDMKTTSVLS
jgi:hypothetical protein